MTMDNRSFSLCIQSPVLVAILFFSSLSWAQETPPEKVRLAYPARSLSALHVQIAQEKGIYRKYGLYVEAIQMRTAITIAALLSKDVQYLTSLGSAMRMALKNAPVKVITISLTAPFFSLVSRSNI